MDSSESIGRFRDVGFRLSGVLHFGYDSRITIAVVCREYRSLICSLIYFVV